MTQLTAPSDALRHQLGLLYSEVAAELRRRQRPPRQLRRLRGSLQARALAAIGGLAGRSPTFQEALLFGLRQYQLAQRGSDFEIDDFGFDREWTEALLPLFRWLYETYWRVEVSGIENVPARGRALLAANHAGVLPWDGAMIKTAIFLKHSSPRHVRALIAQFFFGLPGLAPFLRRTGQTVGHPDDTLRLLQRDELVLVFPEGVRGAGKPWRDRYRLRRFGRGGFVQVAIRARAPIIPVSVVGSEELYPMVADLQPLAKLLGFPYFPITPLFPLAGPLGAIPLPTKWRMQFHPPVSTDELAADYADDQHLVMTVTEQVRDTIQKGIYENLKLRRGTFY